LRFLGRKQPEENAQPLFHQVAMFNSYLVTSFMTTVPASAYHLVLHGTGRPSTPALVGRLWTLRPRISPAALQSFEMGLKYLGLSMLPKDSEAPAEVLACHTVLFGLRCGLHPKGPPAGVRCVQPPYGMRMSECARVSLTAGCTI
jgi:hypothetical protein